MERSRQRVIVRPGADSLSIGVVCFLLSITFCSSVVAQEKPPTDKRYWDQSLSSRSSSNSAPSTPGQSHPGTHPGGPPPYG